MKVVYAHFLVICQYPFPRLYVMHAFLYFREYRSAACAGAKRIQHVDTHPGPLDYEGQSVT
jgi:hypothetical protein